MKKVGKAAPDKSSKKQKRELRPIHILQIGLHDQLGGIETLVMNHYDRIDHDKVQFDFISIHEKMCFEDEIKKIGGKIYHVPSPKKHPIKYYKDLSKIIKSKKYKAIHVHMRSAANILPILAAKRNNTYCITHAHYSKNPANPIKKLLHFLNRPFLSKADTRFACSINAGEWLYSNRSFTVISNATDVQHFKFNKKSRQKFRKEFKIPTNAFVIGHIGRFSKEKNQRFLVKIFQQIHNNAQNSYLILAGSGSDLPKVQALAQKLKLEKNVIFTGQLTDPSSFYNAIDVFAMPSLFEGFPMAGIEAQLSGLPCVFSKNIPREVILNERESKRLPIHQRSVDTWVNTILHITEQSTKTKRTLPKKGQNYDIAPSVKKMTHFYQSININETAKTKFESLLNLAFIMGYTCTVASEMFYTISFIHSLLPIINILGMMCVFIFTSYHLIRQKNKYQILSFCSLLVISMLSYFASQDTIPFKLYLLIFATTFYGFKYCIKLDFNIRLIMLLTVMLCSTLNLTSNFATFSRMDGSLRYTLGFAHPNAFGVYSSMLVIEKLFLDYCDNGKSKYIQNFLISIAVLSINLFVTNSRTTCILLFTIFVIYLIPKKTITKFFQHPLIKILIRYSIFLFAVISFALIAIGQSNSNIASKINSFLSFRPRLFAQYYSSFGFSFLGNDLPNTVSGRTPLDNAYLTMFIKYGFIHFIILSIITVKAIKEMQNKKEYFLTYIFTAMLCFGIMETTAIKPGINPFILALSYAAVQNNKDNKRIA